MWLCDVCAFIFEEQKNKSWVPGYDLQVLSLYSWTQYLHRLNQRVAYSLKGNGPMEIYSDAAIAMCHLRASLAPAPVNPIFIPSPRSLRLSEEDHAEIFCKVLADVLGASQLHALKRTSQSIHRRKTRVERERAAKNRFELKDQMTVEILHEHKGAVVFVDDLITTGSTARAAWQVLCCPPQFEVWTLLNKPSGSC